jgi:hypothetical protein
MDNFFSSPALCDDLTIKKISICGTIKPNCKVSPQYLQLKNGYIWVRVRGDMKALVWKDKYTQSSSRRQFCDEHGNVIKRQQSRTTINIWGMWTNWTGRQIAIPSAAKLGNGQ